LNSGEAGRGNSGFAAVLLVRDPRRNNLGYYAGGTAQYQIEADIVDYGAEMVVETECLWLDLGFCSGRKTENSALVP
jgi:hypothetical protein